MTRFNYKEIMDQSLLYFFNHMLANSIFDAVLLVITLIAPFIYPVLGIAMLFSPRARRMGWAVLFTTALCLGLTLVFQFAVLRPRPAEVVADLRLIWPPPNFPSYPSGHASCAFAIAVLFGLRWRKAWVWAIGLVLASIIAISRVYLGMHYPTDIVAGAILGIGVGATGYGLLAAPRTSPRETLRWLFFTQLAIILVGTHLAYMNLVPWRFLSWPMADKVMHALLMGGAAFWLNLWMNGRTARVWRWLIPLAVLLPFSVAFADEILQSFSPVRTFDLLDLAADLLGMSLMFILSRRVLSRFKRLDPTS